MAEQKDLAVVHRTTMGKATKQLRKKGFIPGNITGHNEEPQAVQVEAVAFDTLRRRGGATNVIRLITSGAPAQTVLIRHVQHDPTSEKVLHIDFSRVSMNERITAKIPLHYVGESPSVKGKGGTLLRLLEMLDIDCPASAIIDSLEVDISQLTEIDATLRASDVKLPAQYTLITPPNESIIKVVATRGETTKEVAASAASPLNVTTE